MTRIDYQAAVELKNSDVPFYALIMAAMMRADDLNLSLLSRAWPAVAREVQARWNAPGGALVGEWPAEEAEIKANEQGRDHPLIFSETGEAQGIGKITARGKPGGIEIEIRMNSEDWERLYATASAAGWRPKWQP